MLPLHHIRKCRLLWQGNRKPMLTWLRQLHIAIWWTLWGSTPHIRYFVKKADLINCVHVSYYQLSCDSDNGCPLFCSSELKNATCSYLMKVVTSLIYPPPVHWLNGNIRKNHSLCIATLSNRCFLSLSRLSDPYVRHHCYELRRVSVLPLSADSGLTDGTLKRI